jgi:hypothetical protein
MPSWEGEPSNYLGNVTMVHILTLLHASNIFFGWFIDLYQYKLLGTMNGYARIYVTRQLFI